MAAHVPTQPVLSAGAFNKAFLSPLSILDRSYSPKLVEKYGAEKYTQLLEMIGRKVKVENNSFYHYERTKRHPSVVVESITGGASAGADVTVTIEEASHWDSGTKSPLRVGEVVQWANNGRLGKITAINTSVADAHTATIKPLRSTEQFNPALGDVLLFQGIQHVGEASGAQTSYQPRIEKITNTVTEIREDYEFTDKAGMEKIEWQDPTSGMYYFQYYGTKEAEMRFLNNREMMTVFSVDVTNTGITSNGTVGNKGMLEQIIAGGSDIGYTGGSMDTIVDLQKVTRELEFNGSNAEIHALMDTYQYQELQRKLFAQYTNGAILWGAAGGSAEVAAKLGFMSYTIDGFTFHFKKYAAFQPEKVYGVAPASYVYKNYGVFIPQGFGNDPMTGQKLPTISLRYQEIPGIGEINAYEYGGLAQSNKTAEQKLFNVLIGHYGVQVQAANQCVIFNG
jgi:hypothetical protein